MTLSVKGPLPAVSMATGFQTLAQGKRDGDWSGNEAHSHISSDRYIKAHTHLAEGALSQDFA